MISTSSIMWQTILRPHLTFHKGFCVQMEIKKTWEGRRRERERKKKFNSTSKNTELSAMTKIPLHTEYMTLAASKVDSLISFSMYANYKRKGWILSSLPPSLSISPSPSLSLPLSPLHRQHTEHMGPPIHFQYQFPWGSLYRWSCSQGWFEQWQVHSGQLNT